MSQDTSSIVIVGAGPGGLAAAMLLAQAGCDVTVLERLDTVGGRTRTISAEGFHFDMGPTFFLYPRILREIFTVCGRRLEDEVEMIRLDPNYRLIFGGGGEIRARCDLDRMAEEIARLAPDDAARLPHYMADNRRKLEAFRPVLETAFDSPFDLLKLDAIRSLPLLRPTRSVDSDLARYFKDPRVRLAFSFQSKYLGMSPFRCPSLFTILSFMEYEYGVFHPKGGCGAVMRAMARVAGEMGVKIETGAPVEEIVFEGRRAVGARTPAGEHRADALVINADFAQTMTKLVPDHLRRRWSDRKIARKRYSCSTFMLYLGIEGRYDHLDHHSIFLSEDYARNIAQIEEGRELPRDPSFYVQNASVTDDSLAPDGHSTLYVLVPVAHQSEAIDWSREAAGYRRLVLDRLAQVGLADLESRIRHEKTVTPADWQSDMEIYRGATFNLAHSMGQMLNFRPHNRFEDLDGVYLVGGGTHPGSGLPVIFESARITAGLMAEDLGFRDSRTAPADAVRPAWAGRTAMTALGKEQPLI